MQLFLPGKKWDYQVLRKGKLCLDVKLQREYTSRQMIFNAVPAKDSGRLFI